MFSTFAARMPSVTPSVLPNNSPEDDAERDGLEQPLKPSPLQ